jgi:sec-independent protein translocase protein TatC
MKFHFQELYLRLFYFSLSFFLTFSLSFYFSQEFFYILSLPFLKFNQGFFIYTSLSEAFFSYLKFSFFLACFISLPSLIFHFYFFLKPGINNRESSFLFNFLLVFFFMYLLSFYFSIVFFLPFSYEFFLGFQKDSPYFPFSLTLFTKIDEYLYFLFKSIFVVSLLFQIPGVLFILLNTNIINIDYILKKRKYVFLLSLIIGSFITPPDIISLLIIAIPLFLFFETLFFCFIIYKEYSL